MHKASEVLQALSIHPEVKRRREFFMSTVLSIKKAGGPKVRFHVDGKGWVAYPANWLNKDKTIAMGLWTDINEKYEMLEDAHFGVYDGCIKIL